MTSKSMSKSKHVTIETNKVNIVKVAQLVLFY